MLFLLQILAPAGSATLEEGVPSAPRCPVCVGGGGRDPGVTSEQVSPHLARHSPESTYPKMLQNNTTKAFKGFSVNRQIFHSFKDRQATLSPGAGRVAGVQSSSRSSSQKELMFRSAACVCGNVNFY